MTPAAGSRAFASQQTAAAILSRALAYDADVLPLAYDGTSITVAVANETAELVEKIRQQTRKDVVTMVLLVRDIRAGLQSLYPALPARDGDSQAAQTLDEIFAAAITSYASDVHLEPLKIVGDASGSTWTGFSRPNETSSRVCSNGSSRSSKCAPT